MQEIRCTNKNRSKEHFLERILESHVGEKLKKGNWLRFKKGTFPKGIKLKQKVKKNARNEKRTRIRRQKRHLKKLFIFCYRESAQIRLNNPKTSSNFANFWKQLSMLKIFFFFNFYNNNKKSWSSKIGSPISDDQNSDDVSCEEIGSQREQQSCGDTRRNVQVTPTVFDPQMKFWWFRSFDMRCPIYLCRTSNGRQICDQCAGKPLSRETF